MSADDTGPGGPLGGLRARIDEIDREVLQLLAKRMEVVREVAEYKKGRGAQVRDYEREHQMLVERRAQAQSLGLAPQPVESVYRQIMLASRDYQASLGAASTQPVEIKRVGVVGGHGSMGRVLCGMFQELGHQVEVADLGTELGVEQLARTSDVLVVAVPIQVTAEVIARVGPAMSPDSLLMDVTSIKTEPMQVMLASTQASVVGSHPMFGPGVHSLLGQRVVVCPGRGQRWQKWLVDNLQARGLVVTEATPEQHDRAMALVQVLTHFQTQVLGLSLARMDLTLEDSRPFTSPAYLMELYVAARHFGQDPELYGPIEMRNPKAGEVTAAFCAAAAELREVLSRGDQPRFNAIFEEVRAFFGDFTREATEQSSFLIDRLVERSMG